MQTKQIAFLFGVVLYKYMFSVLIYLFLGTCIYIVVCAQKLNKKEGRIPRGRNVIGHTVSSEKDVKKKYEEKIERTDNFTFSARNPLIYAENSEKN